VYSNRVERYTRLRAFIDSVVKGWSSDLFIEIFQDPLTYYYLHQQKWYYCDSKDRLAALISPIAIGRFIRSCVILFLQLTKAKGRSSAVLFAPRSKLIVKAALPIIFKQRLYANSKFSESLISVVLFPLPLIQFIIARRLIRCRNSTDLERLGPVSFEIGIIAQLLVFYVELLLRLSRVKIVVFYDFYSVCGRILLKAARRLQVATVCVSHAVNCSDNLHGFCPVTADFQIEWTHDSAQLISELDHHANNSRVFSFGMPEDYLESVSPIDTSSQSFTVLLLAPPMYTSWMFNDASPEELRSEFLSAFHALDHPSIKILVRQKPNRRYRNESLLHEIRIRARHSVVEISASSLEHDISSSCVVVGHSSSVLVSASCAGRASIHLAREGQDPIAGTFFLPMADVSTNLCRYVLNYQSLICPINGRATFDKTRAQSFFASSVLGAYIANNT